MTMRGGILKCLAKCNTDLLSQSINLYHRASITKLDYELQRGISYFDSDFKEAQEEGVEFTLEDKLQTTADCDIANAVSSEAEVGKVAEECFEGFPEEAEALHFSDGIDDEIGDGIGDGIDELLRRYQLDSSNPDFEDDKLGLVKLTDNSPLDAFAELGPTKNPTYSPGGDQSGNQTKAVDFGGDEELVVDGFYDHPYPPKTSPVPSDSSDSGCGSIASESRSCSPQDSFSTQHQDVKPQIWLPPPYQQPRPHQQPPPHQQLPLHQKLPLHQQLPPHQQLPQPHKQPLLKQQLKIQQVQQLPPQQQPLLQPKKQLLLQQQLLPQPPLRPHNQPQIQHQLTVQQVQQLLQQQPHRLSNKKKTENDFGQQHSQHLQQQQIFQMSKKRKTVNNDNGQVSKQIVYKLSKPVQGGIFFVNGQGGAPILSVLSSLPTASKTSASTATPVFPISSSACPISFPFGPVSKEYSPVVSSTSSPTVTAATMRIIGSPNAATMKIIGSPFVGPTASTAANRNVRKSSYFSTRDSASSVVPSMAASSVTSSNASSVIKSSAASPSVFPASSSVFPASSSVFPASSSVFPASSSVFPASSSVFPASSSSATNSKNVHKSIKVKSAAGRDSQESWKEGKSNAKTHDYPFLTLVGMAFKNSSYGCLTVTQIYDFVSHNWSNFEKGDRTWESNVRTTLSTKKQFFVKITNPFMAKMHSLFMLKESEMELLDREMTRDLRGAASVFPQFEKDMRVGFVRHTNTRRLKEMKAILEDSWLLEPPRSMPEIQWWPNNCPWVPDGSIPFPKKENCNRKANPEKANPKSRSKKTGKGNHPVASASCGSSEEWAAALEAIEVAVNEDPYKLVDIGLDNQENIPIFLDQVHQENRSAFVGEECQPDLVGLIHLENPLAGESGPDLLLQAVQDAGIADLF